MSTQSTRPRGFTLVELLVVIAIIGILMSLTLPAIQSVRENGRVTQCQNNMLNLYKASAGYESQFRVMVTGGWSQRWVGQPRYQLEKQPGGWIYQCLPFMEENALATAEGIAGSQQRAQAVLPGLFCPTRRAPTALSFSTNDLLDALGTVSTTTAGRGDYAGSCGTLNTTICDSPSAAPTTISPPSTTTWSFATMNGAIIQRRGNRPPDIGDGKSRTYMFGEKAIAANQVDVGAAGDAYPPLTGFGSSTIRSTSSPIQSDFQNQAMNCAFGSAIRPARTSSFATDA
ncbi:MAG: DUF1559 domain-containing protein [Pirellulales bacterium]